MWVSQAVKEWFQVSRQAYEDLKVKNAALEAELTALKIQAAVDRTHFDWLRMRINALEAENKALIQKAFDINLPAPELSRPRLPMQDPNTFSFDDVGDMLAKQLGYDVFEGSKE